MAVRKILSREDGGLNQATARSIVAKERQYRDIDLTFTAKPNGELYVKRDAAAVKQSVKNLLLTNHFEKPFQPFFGGNLRDLLFELADDDIDEQIRDNIREAIESYEPRAAVLKIDVKARPDYNSVDVTLTFKVRSIDEETTLNVTLQRLR